MARYTLGGSIIDAETGAPKADVELVLKQNGDEVRRASTGDDGRFTFSVEEGDYEVEPADVLAIPPSTQVTVAGDDLTLAFGIRSGYTIGGFVTRNGVAAEGIEVKVTTRTGTTTSTSYAQGEWSAVVPPGRCSIETAGVPPFDVDVTGDEGGLDLEIGEGVAAGEAAVYGRVAREGGAGGYVGVAGAEVEAIVDGQRVGSATTDEDGRYSFNAGVSAGQTAIVRVVDSSMGCEPSQYELSTSGGQMDFLLGSVAVGGRLLSGGHPVTEGTLRIEGVDDPSVSRETRSGDGGTYSFTGLPGGKYRLVPVRPGGDPVEVELRSSLQQDVDVRPAAPGVVVVSGMVFDTNKRLPAVKVELVAGDRMVQEAQTDEDGEFAFELRPDPHDTQLLSLRVAPGQGRYTPDSVALDLSQGHVTAIQFMAWVVQVVGQVLIRPSVGAATVWEGTLRLTHDDGKPIQGYEQFTTYAPGGWLVDVAPGKYTLVPADVTQFRAPPQPFQFEVGEEPPSGLIYYLPPTI